MTDVSTDVLSRIDYFTHVLEDEVRVAAWQFIFRRFVLKRAQVLRHRLGIVDTWHELGAERIAGRARNSSDSGKNGR